MLSQRVGTETLHVPYKGANALNDLLAGRLQFMFATIPSVISHIRAGKLRALAVSSLGASRSLPGVPTVPPIAVQRRPPPFRPKRRRPGSGITAHGASISLTSQLTFRPAWGDVPPDCMVSCFASAMLR